MVCLGVTFMQLLRTGQRTCHDALGRVIPCSGTGQDAAVQQGEAWPMPRFSTEGETVVDLLTGLEWLADANPFELPRTWKEALDLVAELNAATHAGHEDWRLPSCRELRSVVDYQSRRPALPAGHPFRGVFPSWYWTGTTAAVDTRYAWYVNLDGGRMFYGDKEQSYMVWPVRGTTHRLPATPCQVGSFVRMLGHPLPEPRFGPAASGVLDRLTGLVWLASDRPEDPPCTWQRALDRAAERSPVGWRLPNLNELDSLVDYRRARPALAEGHPFGRVPEALWTSTTSLYEPDWAWASYLQKGACGVGQKALPHYHAWFVRGPEITLA